MDTGVLSDFVIKEMRGKFKTDAATKRRLRFIPE
jgi:hypothetical protein